ncbi:MAG: hypothetical protein JXR64_08330 [Spirochaetales bacterium]|nr:hypothetical protein [Spirochaetales bacterium]
MQKFLSLSVFLLFFVSLFSQEIEDKKIIFNETEYDPFFSAVVVDNEGEVFNITRVSFYDEFKDRKFFFWVRRNSALYALSFKNIKKITFTEGDFADDRYKGYTRCTIDLISGENYSVYLKTTGYIEAFDETFASPVTFYLHYNLITSIEFVQNGEYQYCPFCGTIYFNNELDSCIYDKTPLVKGVISSSEK